MKKRLMTLIATLLTAAGSVSAQGFPSVYAIMYCSARDYGDGNFHELFTPSQYLWGENINGMPGQSLGLKASGAKTICSTTTSHLEPELEEDKNKEEYELYPNGLMKCVKSSLAIIYYYDERYNPNGKYVLRRWSTRTFNYDKQWRLQNITENQSDGKNSIYKYIYDKNNRLAKCIYNGEVTDEYIYKYDANNNLTEIISGIRHFYFKNNKLMKETFKDEESSVNVPLSYDLSYDQQGRWTGLIHITPDDVDSYKTWLTLNYRGNDVFPSSVTDCGSWYDPKTKREYGSVERRDHQSTFTFDSKGNWIKWEYDDVSGDLDDDGCTITRTITYYTDEEVKKAVSELEQARKGSTTSGNQENESLWEF